VARRGASWRFIQSTWSSTTSKVPAKPALKFGAVLKGACSMEFGHAFKQV